MANKRDEATTSSGRSRLPPPTAACRIASYRRSRLSPVGARCWAKKSSTSARTRALSAVSSSASRSTVSTGIEGLQPRRLAVASEGDLLDPRLGILEPGFAMALEAITFLIELDRPVERRFALLERADDLFEPLERGFEAQLADIGFGGGHGAVVTPSRS